MNTDIGTKTPTLSLPGVAPLASEQLLTALDVLDRAMDAAPPVMPQRLASAIEVARPLFEALRSGQLPALEGCEDAFRRWYAAQSHQLTNEQVCGLIWARAWQAALSRAAAGALPEFEVVKLSRELKQVANDHAKETVFRTLDDTGRVFRLEHQRDRMIDQLVGYATAAARLQADPAAAQLPMPDRVIDEIRSILLHDPSRIQEALAKLEVVRASARQLYVAARQRRESELLWDQTLQERDHAEQMADRLAQAIGEHFGQPIGEHSNVNNPWLEALDIISSEDPAEKEPLAHAVINVPELYDVIERAASELEEQSDDFDARGNNSTAESFRARAFELRQCALGALPRDPLDTRLMADVEIGGGTLRRGTTLRTLVRRLELLHGIVSDQMQVARGKPVSTPRREGVAALHALADALELGVENVHAGFVRDAVAVIPGLPAEVAFEHEQRLGQLLVEALGPSHPALDDFAALVFASRQQKR